MYMTLLGGPRPHNLSPAALVGEDVEPLAVFREASLSQFKAAIASSVLA